MQGDESEGRRLLSEFPALMGDFRRRTVLVPMQGGGFMTGEDRGLRWLYAFTSEDTLAKFAHDRGEAGEWEYGRVQGARLLDELIPSLDFPCGVAVDAASEGGLLLPPVKGVVPASAAYDTDVEGETE